MFRKTSEQKVLRDPVHGYIHVDYEVVWDCINSRWFQRLRRIRQLGGAYTVYHTADHTRFAHSLGVYEIVRRMVTEVPDLSAELDEKEKVTVMLAALLHDIGHGPYSHAFEAISRINHEVYTVKIIEEDPEISGILNGCADGLARDVADVLRNQHRNPLLVQLISAQLDADRMDYLLRDAYFTGTAYGEFDLERILRTIRVSEGHIVVKESGIYAVENYIMARYHMYWQVYYHPVARSYENVIRMLFTRLRDLSAEGKEIRTVPALLPLLNGEELSLEEFFPMDEYTCSYGFQLLAREEDPVTADLAERILNRNLFKYAENTPENVERITAELHQHGYDERYYLAYDEVGQRPYVPYQGDDNKAIWILMHTGEIEELSKASAIVKALVRGPVLSDDRIFYPLMKKDTNTSDK